MSRNQRRVASRSFAIGVDIGGTFTDVVAVGTGSGELFVAKVLTEYGDLARGVMSGIGKVLSENGIEPSSVTRVVHGTTLVANSTPFIGSIVRSRRARAAAEPAWLDRTSSPGGPLNSIYYVVDDYTDGWTRPDCVLMLHGIAETGEAWRGWVPHFARNYRVIRPDLRGFGKSGVLHAPIRGVDVWADDIVALVNESNCSRVHVVGAKLGALIGMELARRKVAWMKTLTIAGLLVSPRRAVGPWVQEWFRRIDDKGVESWARLTMPGRMGGALGARASEWWTQLMGKAPPESVKACLEMVSHVGEPEGLEQFEVPTLVMVASGEKTAAADFDQRQPVATVKALCARIPISELYEVPATSYHVAATHPDACARRTLQFIDTHSKGR